MIENSTGNLLILKVAAEREQFGQLFEAILMSILLF